MTRPEKEDNALLTVLQESSCEGGDAIRKLVRHTIQAVLNEEMTVFLNAGSYELTEGRRGYRNGYESRVLKTRVGRLELMVPKDREGSVPNGVVREVPAE